MAIRSNRQTFEVKGALCKLTQMSHRHGEPELLIEIAVVKMPLPIDTDQLAAHHRSKIGGIVGMLQQFLITRQFSALFKATGIPLDRHVHKGEQSVEANALMGKFLFVILFELSLRGGQNSSLRIEDEVKGETSILAAVTETIQLQQPLDAALKDPLASLLINIVGAVAGQRSHHGDAMGRKKLSQILLSGFRENREIAAIDHFDAKGTQLLHQGAEPWMKLRSTSREVNTDNLL